MKIKTPNLFRAALVALTMFVYSSVSAQSPASRPLRFGIGVEGLFPVGSRTNLINPGLGLTPRLQYTASDKVAFTFTSGIYHFFPKTVTIPSNGFVGGITYKNESDIIPVKVGAKIFVRPNLYVSGEAGAAFEVANGGGPVYFLASPGIGYANKKWDIGARYENFSGDGIIGLRVAYGFGL